MEIKKENRVFLIHQYKKEEEYLRQRHREGWKFVSTNLFGPYIFEKCQPEDMVYQLDFNSDLKKNKDAYLQVFRDCGWEYLQELNGFVYFRKPAAEMNGEEEIFSDESSRTAMAQRVIRGRILPLGAIFCCILPNTKYCMSEGPIWIRILWGLILLVYMAIFVSATIIYFKLKSKE